MDSVNPAPTNPASQVDSVELFEDVLEFVGNVLDDQIWLVDSNLHGGRPQVAAGPREVRDGSHLLLLDVPHGNGHLQRGLRAEARQLPPEAGRTTTHLHHDRTEGRLDADRSGSS